MFKSGLTINIYEKLKIYDPFKILREVNLKTFILKMKSSTTLSEKQDLKQVIFF